MKLFNHLGRVLGHPSNAYFYSHWATAHTAGLPPRPSQTPGPASADTETFR